MNRDLVIPVDLREKRLVEGYTQETLGEELGVHRQRVNEYESGGYNIPFDKACHAALLFDGITVRHKGIDFELRPKQRKKVPEVIDGDKPVDSAINVARELKDVKGHLDGLIEHAAAIRNGKCEGKQWVTTFVKELAELVAVGNRGLKSSQTHYPEEWKEGMALAFAELADRYGVVGVEIGDSTSVA